MRTISWNTRGLKEANKRLALKRSLKKHHNPDVVLSIIKSLWNSKHIGWDFVESFGSIGGIFTLWYMRKLMVVRTLKGEYSSSVKCITICKRTCWITNVYGPNDYKERNFVWPKLLSLSNNWNDFNITRWEH